VPLMFVNPAAAVLTLLGLVFVYLLVAVYRA
jgi:hypothetical protein